MPVPQASQSAFSRLPEKDFLVVGQQKFMVVQVMLAIHAFTKANCIAVCSREARFLRLSNLCSASIGIEFDGQDDERFAEFANRQGQKRPGMTIVPADCDGERLVGRVRGRLKAGVIPIPDLAMLDRFDNKWHFYQFCRQSGLHVPPSCFMLSKHDGNFSRIVRDVGLPFIVKPVNEDSSTGVELIADEDAYRRRILNNEDYRHAPLIAQTYVPGTDVGLNFLALGGMVKAIAVQQRFHPQHDGAKIRFISNDYLERAAHVIAEKSAYDGVMNVDARVEEGSGKVFLLESNPRFWRSLSASVWCGLNFVEASLTPPSEFGEEVRRLHSGTADTFYHPLFRGSLLRDAMLGRGHRGRMARLMLYDLCTLAAQAKYKLALRFARLQTVLPGSVAARNSGSA